MNQPAPLGTVMLIARRELEAKVRGKAFLAGTGVSIVVLAAFVLMQGTFGDTDRTVVGLSGQAIAVAPQLTAAGAQLDQEIEIRELADAGQGAALVADGELDALVTGAPAALDVLVKEELDADLRLAMDTIVQQEVLKAQLAAEELDAEEVLGPVAGAHAAVRALEPADPQRGQRLAMALLIIALLYVSLLLYGTMVAQGVVEEKSSRVVEMLLSTVRPGHLLAGKVLGLGLVGLIQLAVVGGVGTVLALVTGVLTLPGMAAGTLLWGLVWYLLGFFLYATVFAAAGSLVSRQEEVQPVLVPVTLVLVIAFVLGFSVLTQDASSTTSTVLSLIPPLSPVLMPGVIALGAAQTWQVLTAIVLTIASIAALAFLGGRIYANAVLHMGARLRLRDIARAAR